MDANILFQNFDYMTMRKDLFRTNNFVYILNVHNVNYSVYKILLYVISFKKRNGLGRYILF